MKVLMVIPALGNVYGGPSQCVLELARSLGNLEIGVDIATTNANGSTTLDVPLRTWIDEPYYRIRYFPYWGWNDYKLSASFARWLFQNVTHYDLIQTHAIFSPINLFAYWACQQHQVPYAVTTHGMLEPWALSYKAWKKCIYYALFEKPALDRARVVQMLASPEAERVTALQIEAPFVVIPNGIHRCDFDPLSNPEPLYRKFPETRNKRLVLFLGRIDPKKGLDLLATAFLKVCVQFPQAHLLVAGPDNIGFLPTVRGYFAQAGCLESVTFAGMLTGELKYAALCAAQVYVAPSYSEGFSLSILEGMAAGLPCVITTGCNFPEADAARAARVVNINSEELMNALIQLLAEPKQAKEMGDRARQLIFDRYTWDRIAASLIDVYTAIIDRKPIPHLYSRTAINFRL